MPNTTAFNRGDVALVNFMFTEGTQVRRRPAVLISSEHYQSARQEVVVAAVTSNVGRILAGDHQIVEWQAAGLLFPSVATGIIRTLKQSMLVRRLGSLTLQDMAGVEDSLRFILRL